MNGRNTVMKHDFSKAPSISIERSKFDRSHGLKTTLDAGWLVPIYVDEVLPGDTFNLRLDAFARLATPIKPVMDNMYLDTFFFFVPNRLVWNNWERFQGAQDDPDDTTDYEVPQIQVPAEQPILTGSLHDYMGLPVKVGATTAPSGWSFNSLHSRAYNLIWNNWFRAQDLQDSVTVDKDDGPDVLADYVLLRRGKRHDYFTSALPWPQKGDAITLPLGELAPIVPTGYRFGQGAYVNADMIGNRTQIRQTTDGAPAASDTLYTTTAGGIMQSGDGGGQVDVFINPMGSSTTFSSLQADLSAATSADVNTLREALQMQVLLERDARGGTRYVEAIKSRFGVVSPDFRLQRPEYLGGGSSPINIHPVPQTTISGTTPQGNLAGFGTASFSGHGFNKSFVEHGVIIGLANVRADLTYQQGLNRMWSRRTRYDFYEPALAHLGEQAVLNKEIWFQGAEGTTPDASDDDVFGYQERYAEYRYKPSQITGAFRSQYATSLDYWHLSQEFTALPELGDTFIQDDPPIDRVIAVTSEPHIILDAYFKLICARPMPVYAIPTLGDRL